jgi:NSS family neurotransmitter:Na+ symporter
VFQQAFASVPVAGYVISILFYALLVFAALTSTISMHEIGTAFFTEERRMPRRRAAWVLTTVCSLLAVLCSLSVGAVDTIRVLDMSLMDFCDYLTAQFMLPLGAFLTSLFLGWFANQRVVRDEFTNGGSVARGLFPAYQFAVRFIVPLCILLIFLHQFGVV